MSKNYRNRFVECKVGDVISVYSLSLDETYEHKNLYHVDEFALRANEVGSFCAFEYPIVFVGKTKSSGKETTFMWFNCIYSGKKGIYISTLGTLNELIKK